MPDAGQIRQLGPLEHGLYNRRFQPVQSYNDYFLRQLLSLGWSFWGILLGLRGRRIPLNAKNLKKGIHHFVPGNSESSNDACNAGGDRHNLVGPAV